MRREIFFLPFFTRARRRKKRSTEEVEGSGAEISVTAQEGDEDDGEGEGKKKEKMKGGKIELTPRKHARRKWFPSHERVRRIGGE